MTKKLTLCLDLAPENVGFASDLKFPVSPSQSITEGLWQGRRFFGVRMDASKSRFVLLGGLRLASLSSVAVCWTVLLKPHLQYCWQGSGAA